MAASSMRMVMSDIAQLEKVPFKRKPPLFLCPLFNAQFLLEHTCQTIHQFTFL
jgi:hypothetical protein